MCVCARTCVCVGGGGVCVRLCLCLCVSVGACVSVCVSVCRTSAESFFSFHSPVAGSTSACSPRIDQFGVVQK